MMHDLDMFAARSNKSRSDFYPFTLVAIILPCCVPYHLSKAKLSQTISDSIYFSYTLVSIFLPDCVQYRQESQNYLKSHIKLPNFLSLSIQLNLGRDLSSRLSSISPSSAKPSSALFRISFSPRLTLIGKFRTTHDWGIKWAPIVTHKNSLITIIFGLNFKRQLSTSLRTLYLRNWSTALRLFVSGKLPDIVIEGVKIYIKIYPEVFN